MVTNLNEVNGVKRWGGGVIGANIKMNVSLILEASS